jgi:chromosome segregation ATPase
LEGQRGEAERLRQEAEAARSELESQHSEFEAARRELEGQRGEAERLRQEAEAARSELESQRAEAERLRQEAEASRQQCTMMRREMDAVDQERRRLAALLNGTDTAFQETQLRFQEAVARFTQLVEQIQSLQTELRRQQELQSGPTGLLGRLWPSSSSKGKGEDQLALARRLEMLRGEATAERERVDRASAEAARANLELQLANVRRQFQEATERADRLEAELQEHRGRSALRLLKRPPRAEGDAPSG